MSGELSSPSIESFYRPRGRPTRVLFAGDSLTAGSYATTAAKAFPSLLTKWIGPTTATYSSRSGKGVAAVDAVTQVPPGLDLAVVELGTNDVRVTPVPEFSRAYSAFLGRVRSSSRRAAVVCIGVWSPAGADYDAAIAAACRAAGGMFAPVSQLYVQPALRGPAGRSTFQGRSDNIHPNDEGHRRMAELLVGVLSSG